MTIHDSWLNMIEDIFEFIYGIKYYVVIYE